MRNYPKIIKNLNISSDFNTIANDLERNGFIVKGIVDSENDLVTYHHSNGTTSSLNNIQHNAYEYVPAHQKKQLFELYRKTNPVLDDKKKAFKITFYLDLFMIPSFLILLQSPLCAGVMTFFAASEGFEYSRYKTLDELIDLDIWYVNHQKEVEERLQENNPLYKKLSSKSKQLLSIGDGLKGRLTLNNIEEFPMNDLILVRRTMENEKRKEEKIRKKAYKEIRGM